MQFASWLASLKESSPADRLFACKITSKESYACESVASACPTEQQNDMCEACNMDAKQRHTEPASFQGTTCS